MGGDRGVPHSAVIRPAGHARICPPQCCANTPSCPLDAPFLGNKADKPVETATRTRYLLIPSIEWLNCPSPHAVMKSN